LDFLQNASEEMFISLVRALIGPTYDSTDIYMLQGGEVSTSGPNYAYGAGLIIYGGELYRLKAVNIPILGFLTAQCNFVDTYLSGTDPTLFTDLNTYNVHQDRHIEIVSGTSGSGDFNYSDIIFLEGVSTLSLQTNYFNYSTYGSACRVHLRGNVVTFSGGILIDSGAATGQTMFTLDKRFRPVGNDRYIYTHIEPFGAEMRTAILKVAAATGIVSIFSVDTTPWTGGPVLSLEGVSFVVRTS
jgi:hypothetical protein